MIGLIVFGTFLVILVIGGLMWDAQGRTDTTLREPPAFAVQVVCRDCGRHLLGRRVDRNGRPATRLYELCAECRKRREEKHCGL